jgi:colanic acid/amylovoran biosynthesis glycosyltransferase
LKNSQIRHSPWHNWFQGNEEGLPVAILEAMSYLLPVLSTGHAGIPEAVLEGVTEF